MAKGKTKKVKEKKFPNGFRYWLETFYEAVALITIYQFGDAKQKAKPYHIIDEWQNSGGRCNLYDLAKEWADEFEKVHQYIEWGHDADWFETVDIFMHKKAMSEEYTLDMMAKY